MAAKLKRPGRKGAATERLAIKLLEKCGYLCTKSGGSLGLFDIIAVPDLWHGATHYPYKNLLIQVKTNTFGGCLEGVEQQKYHDCGVDRAKNRVMLWRFKTKEKKWDIYERGYGREWVFCPATSTLINELMQALYG